MNYCLGKSLSLLIIFLQSQHTTEFEAYKEYAKTNKVSLNINRKRWSCTFRQEDWEANITAFVLDSMSPLSIVENRWFRKIFVGITFIAYDNINRFAWVRYFFNHSVDFNIEKNGITVKHMT